MAGEVKSWVERKTAVREIMGLMRQISGLYQKADRYESSQHRQGFVMSTLEPELVNILDGITDIEVVLDARMTALLDDAQFSEIPVYWKSGEHDLLDHLEFAAATSGVDGTITAKSKDDVAIDVHFNDVLAAGDLFDVTTAEDSENNGRYEIQSVTGSIITTKGEVGAALRPDAEEIDFMPTAEHEKNFIANVLDTSAQIQFVYKA